MILYEGKQEDMAVEIWDLYDENRNLTGKTVERGGRREKGLIIW